jgi:hypothetical protein
MYPIPNAMRKVMILELRNYVGPSSSILEHETRIEEWCAYRIDTEYLSEKNLKVATAPKCANVNHTSKCVECSGLGDHPHDRRCVLGEVICILEVASYWEESDDNHGSQ